MLKHILATTALATLLATGLHAQNATEMQPEGGVDATQDMDSPAALPETASPDAVGGATMAEEEVMAPGAGNPVGDQAEGEDATAVPAPTLTQDAAPAASDPAVTEGEAAAASDPAAGAEGAAESVVVEEDATDPALAEEDAAGTTEPVVVEEDAAGADDPALAGEGAAGVTDPALAEQDGAVGTAVPAEGATELGAAGDPFEGWAPVELSAISAEELMGAQIVTFENERIATIEDVLISKSGAVENLVAQFGGFLGFGENQVLLTMEEVEILQQDGGDDLMVRTSLTPESIEGRPEYEEEAQAVN